MRTSAALLLLAAVAAAERPRLVVVVSVDQMRRDTLTRFAKEYTGGLKRMLDKGLRYRGLLDHALTQTGPGHSTILTGCHPARTGIVANEWLDRKTLKPVYCVDDRQAPVYGVKGKGRSPKLVLRDALGDWMKAADGRAKVFSVSCKDRAAIVMGGRRPDGVFWLERKGGGFSTSAYYAPEGLPEWLVDFNEDGWIERLPEHWTYEPVAGLRDDDDPRESGRFSRASPHPLRTGDRTKVYDHVYHSPFGDALTLRLARRLVERFDLGGDEVCDLLAISLAATDTVGHLYGPYSQEIRDTTLRLDRNLGRLFDFLDERGAPYLVVLASDHGVLPMDGMTRVDARPLIQRVAVAVQRKHGGGDWWRFSAGQIYVNHSQAGAAAVPATIVAALGTEGAIRSVYDRAAMTPAPGEAADGIRDLLRRSFHPDRSGDVFPIVKERTLLSVWKVGTSHGSPHKYDREIPLVFWGPGIPPGERAREARTVDIAPTLARRIGVSTPGDLDGEVIPLE